MFSDKESTKIIIIGFGFIGLLFIIFLSGWIYSLYDNQNRLQTLISESKEVKLFNQMKSIGFKRNMAVLRMIIKKDEFDRDDEFMFLRSQGEEFIKLRERLFKEYTGEHGKQHWANVAEAAGIAQEIQLEIIDLLIEDRDEDAILLIDKLFMGQEKIAQALDQETSVVEKEGVDELIEATKTNNILRYLAWSLLAISIVAGYMVIFVVIRKIQNSEKALTDYGYKVRELYNISVESGVNEEEQIMHMLVVACQLMNMDHVLVVRNVNKSDKETLYEYSRVNSLTEKSIEIVKRKLCDPSIYSNNTISMSNMKESYFWVSDQDIFDEILSCISIPFKVNNQAFGVLCILDHKTRDNHFTNEDDDFVKLISSWLGFSIERYLDNQALKILKEDAESANISKSEFLGNMSHELRTPMHAILSYAGFGVKRFATANDEKKLSYFSKIQTSANTLLRLLDDILDLSKLEAKKMDFIFKRNNINENITEVVDEFKAMAREHQVYLKCDFEVNSYEMNYDVNRLKQVFRNLVSNAIKFSNKGDAIQLKTSIENSSILFQIIDQGIGIPENELIDIFDKFKQSSKTNSGAGGTGLGLAICREIVQAHKGQIWAESNIPHGSIFNVSIPVNLEYNEFKKVS